MDNQWYLNIITRNTNSIIINAITIIICPDGWLLVMTYINLILIWLAFIELITLINFILINCFIILYMVRVDFFNVTTSLHVYLDRICIFTLHMRYETCSIFIRKFLIKIFDMGLNPDLRVVKCFKENNDLHWFRIHYVTSEYVNKLI